MSAAATRLSEEPSSPPNDSFKARISRSFNNKYRASPRVLSTRRTTDKERGSRLHSCEERSQPRFLRNGPQTELSHLIEGDEENAADDLEHVADGLVFLPTSAPVQAWELIGFLWLVFSAFEVPYRLAFARDDYTPIYLVIDIFFALDVLRCYRTAYFDKNGHLVTSLSYVRYHYVSVWLVPDLVATLPGWIGAAYGVPTAPRMMLLARLSKLLPWIRCMQDVDVANHVISLLGERTLDSSRAHSPNALLLQLMRSDVARLLLHWIGVCLAGHLLACVHVLTAKARDSSGTPDSWVERASLGGVPAAEMYMGALCHALQQLLLVSPGLVSPEHPEERLLLTITMAIGVVLLSVHLVAVFTRAMRKMRRADAHGERHDEYEGWMCKMALSADLRNKVHLCVEWAYTQSVHADEQLYNQLSQPLREQLKIHRCAFALQVLSIDISPHPGGIDHRLAGAVALHMKHGIYLDGHYLIRQRRMDHGLFVIHQGAVQVLVFKESVQGQDERARADDPSVDQNMQPSPDGRIERTLDQSIARTTTLERRSLDQSRVPTFHGAYSKESQYGPGAVIGEISLLNYQSTMPTASVRSSGYCVAFHLSQEDFKPLAKRFPELRTKIQNATTTKRERVHAARRIQRVHRASLQVGTLEDPSVYGARRTQRVSLQRPTLEDPSVYGARRTQRASLQTSASEDSSVHGERRTQLASSRMSFFEASSAKQLLPLSLSKTESSRRGAAAFILSPMSRISLSLDAALLLLLAYTAVVLPCRIALQSQQVDRLRAPSPFGVFELVMDVFFLGDVLRSTHTAFFDENGKLIRHPPAVRQHYLRGWFVLDVLSTIPFDWLLKAVSRSSITTLWVEIAALLRLLRLLRAPRAIARVAYAFHSTTFARHAKAVHLVRLYAVFRSQGWLLLIRILGFALAGHLLACLQLLASKNRDELGTRTTVPSWVSRAGLSEASPIERYSGGLCHALQQLLMISAGLVPPEHPEEMVFSILSVLTGISCLADAIASHLGPLSRRWARYTSITMVSTELLQRANVPPELHTRLLVYLNRASLNGHLEDDERMLSVLSMPMREQICACRYKDVLIALGIPEEDALAEGQVDLRGLQGLVAVLFQPRLFLPGEYLIREQTRTAGLFFIRFGSVDVLVSRTFNLDDGARQIHEQLITRLGAGSFVGEKSLIDNELTSASVRASGLTHTILLSTEQFDSFKEQHPEMVDLLLVRIRTYMLINRISTAVQQRDAVDLKDLLAQAESKGVADHETIVDARDMFKRLAEKVYAEVWASVMHRNKGGAWRLEVARKLADCAKCNTTDVETKSSQLFDKEKAAAAAGATSRSASIVSTSSDAEFIRQTLRARMTSRSRRTRTGSNAGALGLSQPRNPSDKRNSVGLFAVMDALMLRTSIRSTSRNTSTRWRSGTAVETNVSLMDASRLRASICSRSTSRSTSTRCQGGTAVGANNSQPQHTKRLASSQRRPRTASDVGVGADMRHHTPACVGSAPIPPQSKRKSLPAQIGANGNAPDDPRVSRSLKNLLSKLGSNSMERASLKAETIRSHESSRARPCSGKFTSQASLSALLKDSLPDEAYDDLPWQLHERSDELYLWMTKCGIECDFWFLKADHIRKASAGKKGSSYRFKPFQALHRSDCLEEITITLEGACNGHYWKATTSGDGTGRLDYRILAVSHRWEDPINPDPTGAQATALQKYLAEHPDITHVFYDYSCLPQERRNQPRTFQEKHDFNRMLKNVNLVYLGARCLLLVDISYLSRFWTQFEAWLAFRTPTVRGLDSTDKDRVSDRTEIIPLHNATGIDREKVLSMWANCDHEKAKKILGAPDVTVTSQKDKKVQLDKIYKLHEDVRDVMTKCLQPDLQFHRLITSSISANQERSRRLGDFEV